MCACVSLDELKPSNQKMFVLLVKFHRHELIFVSDTMIRWLSTLFLWHVYRSMFDNERLLLHNEDSRGKFTTWQWHWFYLTWNGCVMVTTTFSLSRAFFLFLKKASFYRWWKKEEKNVVFAFKCLRTSTSNACYFFCSIRRDVVPTTSSERQSKIEMIWQRNWREDSDYSQWERK